MLRRQNGRLVLDATAICADKDTEVHHNVLWPLQYTLLLLMAPEECRVPRTVGKFRMLSLAYQSVAYCAFTVIRQAQQSLQYFVMFCFKIPVRHCELETPADTSSITDQTTLLAPKRISTLLIVVTASLCSRLNGQVSGNATCSWDMQTHGAGLHL